MSVPCKFERRDKARLRVAVRALSVVKFNAEKAERASPSARRPVRSCSRSRRIAASVFPLDRRAARTC
jgi:hypothetical protein